VSAAPALTIAQAARIMREARYRHPGLFVWVYAIQAGTGGPIKIGVTQKPAERLATLQQGNAETLRGVAAWRAFAADEKWLHQEFAHARIRGEWFEPVPELVELVLRLGGDFEDWDA
jgi:hypothetical protein